MGSGNIHEFGRFCKPYVDEAIASWGLIILIILVGLASFGLGRLSALVEAKPLISVSEAASAGVLALSGGGYYVASKSGSTYYFPWCTGAQKIAAQNQRWFQSEADAKAAGYKPAKNCKGLAV